MASACQMGMGCPFMDGWNSNLYARMEWWKAQVFRVSQAFVSSKRQVQERESGSDGMENEE